MVISKVTYGCRVWNYQTVRGNIPLSLDYIAHWAPTAGPSSTGHQTKVKDHPVNLEVIHVQHVVSPWFYLISTPGFLLKLRIYQSYSLDNVQDIKPKTISFCKTQLEKFQLKIKITFIFKLPRRRIQWNLFKIEFCWSFANYITSSAQIVCC